MLSSLSSTRSPSTKKSTRASPLQPAAPERLDRHLSDALAHPVRHPRRHDQLHPAGRVLGLVVVPARLAGGQHDLARLGGDRIAVADHRALDLEPAGGRLDDRQRVVLERGLQRRRQLGSDAATRTIPTEEPSRAGLTNTGRPEPGEPGEHAAALGRTMLGPDRAVVDLGQPGVRHQLLEHHLVHAQRRGEHAGAHVRDVEALEQALHGAVLAERTVQHREHDVDAVESPPGLDATERAVAPPHAVAADLDRDRVVPGVARAPRGPTPPRRATPRARRSGPRRAPRRERASRLLLRRRGRAGRRRRRASGRRARGASSASAPTYLPTTIVTCVRFLAWVAGGRILAEHDAVLGLVGHRLLLHGGREAGGAERGLGRAARSCRPRSGRPRWAGPWPRPGSPSSRWRRTCPRSGSG